MDALPTSTRVPFGVQKVRRLAAAGISIPVAYAYTDSATDLPLLLAANERYVVDPGPRRLRRIAAGRAGVRPAAVTSLSCCFPPATCVKPSSKETSGASCQAAPNPPRSARCTTSFPGLRAARPA